MLGYGSALERACYSCSRTPASLSIWASWSSRLALERCSSKAAAQYWQGSLALGILERHRERGVDGERAEDESDDAGDGLPAVAGGQLVEAGGREAQRGGGENGGRDELAGRRGAGGDEHRDGGEQQEQAESVAGGAGLAGQRHEADRQPGAAQDPHAGPGHDVAGEEAQDGGDELERDDERDEDERDLRAVGRAAASRAVGR